MRALRYYGNQDLRFEDVPTPNIAPNEILMKVKQVGICGTDLHIYSGGMTVPTPLIMGHEFVGDIVEVGSEVKNIKIGDKAVAEHVIGCGKCAYCQTGLKNLCQTPTVIGLHKSGALAEYIALQADLVYTLPENFSYEAGVLVEPLSIAVYALRKANIKTGDKVAVVGQGPIGLFVDQVAQAEGAHVFGFDINRNRLGHAQTNGFIKVGYDTSTATYMQEFQETIGSDGADVVFEVVGKELTAQLSLDLAKREGKVIVLGVFEHDIKINAMNIVKKELTVMGSWTCLNAFEETISLIGSGKININGLITHRYKFDDAINAFKEASDTTTNRIKSIIEF